jgi:hypothetical protein
MRTQNEIQNEISALKALRPIGRHAGQTRRKIALAIEELENGVDYTFAVWNELSDTERDIVMETREWKRGGLERPSEGWNQMVE